MQWNMSVLWEVSRELHGLICSCSRLKRAEKGYSRLTDEVDLDIVRLCHSASGPLFSQVCYGSAASGPFADVSVLHRPLRIYYGFMSRRQRYSLSYSRGHHEERISGPLAGELTYLPDVCRVIPLSKLTDTRGAISKPWWIFKNFFSSFSSSSFQGPANLGEWDQWRTFLFRPHPSVLIFRVRPPAFVMILPAAILLVMLMIEEQQRADLTSDK
ncbi:hypothetical protein GE09DRAFT_478333 [Coniochaeta sp. 2T2.1]|nr:hypothetical protein GE09DRAFT_478333 [Coniochaeta sp. 2T2.1]